MGSDVLGVTRTFSGGGGGDVGATRLYSRVTESSCLAPCASGVPHGSPPTPLSMLRRYVHDFVGIHPNSGESPVGTNSRCGFTQGFSPDDPVVHVREVPHGIPPSPLLSMLASGWAAWSKVCGTVPLTHTDAPSSRETSASDPTTAFSALSSPFPKLLHALLRLSNPRMKIGRRLLSRGLSMEGRSRVKRPLSRWLCMQGRLRVKRLLS